MKTISECLAAISNESDKIKHEQLASGVIVCSFALPAPVEELLPALTGVACCRCGKRSVEQIAPLSFSTSDGFAIHWPTCGHGKYAQCEACEGRIYGCPVCGNQEDNC